VKQKNNLMPVVAIVGFATLMGTAINWRVLPVVVVCLILATGIAVALSKNRRKAEQKAKQSRDTRTQAQTLIQRTALPVEERRQPAHNGGQMVIPPQSRISSTFDALPVEQVLPAQPLLKPTPNTDRPQPTKSLGARLTAAMRTRGMNIHAAVFYDGQDNPVTVREIVFSMIPLIQKAGHDIDVVAARLPDVYFNLWDYAGPACEQFNTIEQVRGYIATLALSEVMKEKG